MGVCDRRCRCTGRCCDCRTDKLWGQIVPVDRSFDHPAFVRYNKNPPPYSRGVSFFMTIIIKNSLGRWISLYAVAICDSTLLSSAICFAIIICSYADVKCFPHFACVSLIIHFIISSGTVSGSRLLIFLLLSNLYNVKLYARSHCRS